jgi:ATP-binding protein involved in chromosome partitioning
MITEQHVLDALSKVLDPELGKDLVSLNMIRDIKIHNNDVSFSLVLTTPACPLRNQIEASAKKAVLEIPGVENVNINVNSQVPSHQSKPEMLSLPIKHIIAVGSGKGGVGKSTIAVNLAIALALSGARVGLLDADIYGPNIPKMMGISELPKQSGQKLVPAEAFGIKVMSTGFLVKKDQPLIWRGPLLHSIIRQFFEDVLWDELDYLVVDLPPGTGDVQLSLSQVVSISGGIIVTTPQEVSLEDAGRALVMYQKLNIPILGVIENMGALMLPDGSRMEIFGSGGGKRLAESNCVPFLGSIELDPKIREGGDLGLPIISKDNHSRPALEIRRIAGEIAAQLSIQTIRTEARKESK